MRTPNFNLIVYKIVEHEATQRFNSELHIPSVLTTNFEQSRCNLSQ